MATEPTHIDGEVLYLVLAGVPVVVAVLVGSPVIISDHSSVLIDVGLD